MKTILFPTDFTNTAPPALAFVRLFARQYGARIVVMHAYQPIMPDTTLPVMGDLGAGVEASHELEEISRNNLDELAGRLQSEGFDVVTEWRIGGVEDEILDAARQYNADLIITGRSELTTFFDRLAGSAAADVALGAPCPVLVVPSHDNVAATRAGAGLASIVYASQLEFDESTLVRQVADLARQFGATLKILNVDAENQPNVFDDKQFLEQLQQEYGAERLRVERVKARTVTGGLQDYLTHHSADLIVMTTRERGFLDGLLNPSLTERMVLRSDVPVLVYHATDATT